MTPEQEQQWETLLNALQEKHDQLTIKAREALEAAQDATCAMTESRIRLSHFHLIRDTGGDAILAKLAFDGGSDAE